MSLRTKTLLWIIAVNLGIAGFLLGAIHSSVEAQRVAGARTLENVRANRDEVLWRLFNILHFLSGLEEEEISLRSILSWDQWRHFDDAMVVMDIVEFEGEVIATNIVLNPLGRLGRSASSERRTAFAMAKTAIEEDRRVTHGGAYAIPIHRRAAEGGALFGGARAPGGLGKIWGAAYVRPRFPEIEPALFDFTVFWIGLGGGTLILIAATYVILSRLVIRPVEEMAAVADLIAQGDFRSQVTHPGTRDEVGRLIHSFNYMIAEVRDYHRRLQEKLDEVRERVNMAEKHLAVAQRLASTGALAAGIAHEINNPIGGMVNAAIRLKEQAAPGSRAEVYLDLIIEGLDRMKSTARKVLAFSPRKVDPQPARLAALLDDSAALIQHRLKEAAIRLRIDVDPPDIEITCDPGEIRQVFLNVLINAVDAIAASDAGARRRGQIAVGARRDPVEAMAVIEVSDNGAGMSAETLRHAFDPFFTTKPAGAGSGLGLSIAHNIVTSHGGRIEAESSPGRGTTIRVVLPIN